jgi:hypothetical protein
MDKLEGKLFELRESIKKSPKSKFAFPIAKKKRRNSVAENFTAPCKKIQKLTEFLTIFSNCVSSAGQRNRH